MILHHAFLDTAKCHGNKLAFLDRTLERRVSYQRALVGALLLAARFRQYPERYLGIMLPTSAGCGLSILAALMAGKVPVMINYSTGAAENAEYAQRKCGFRVVVTSRTLLKRINCREVPGMVYVEDFLAQATLREKLQAALTARLPAGLLQRYFVAPASPDDTAVVLFTSGSEKDPKAVPLTHRNIFSNVRLCGEGFQCRAEDTLLAVLPLFHVFGLTATFWLPITIGMTIITYANPLDFKTVASIIREERPTLMLATPYFFMGYLRQAADGDFSSLRLAVAGADKVPDALREAFRTRHQVELYEGYGATETSPVISANFPGANRPGSIGKPLAGMEVRVRDLDTDAELRPGQEGKIVVKGDSVMSGYLNDPENTAKSLVDGWYDTGDMGTFDEDGFLWHLGRRKRFIKVGGEMVSLVQVEAEMQKLIAGDIECCAVEMPDAKRGATVGVAVTQPVDERAILSQLGKQLPAIAVPKQFFVLDELPKMGSGKIDFRKTTERVRALLG